MKQRFTSSHIKQHQFPLLQKTPPCKTYYRLYLQAPPLKLRYPRITLYFVGYFYNLTHSISYRLRIYISHPQQTCTKIAIKKSNEGGARAYWQVGFEIIDVFLFRLPSHLSLGWSCFLSNVCPRISSCFGLIIWHKAVRFDIFSNRR